MGSYAYTPFPYATPPELRGAKCQPYRVVIVGAGPVGLSAAIDFAMRGISVLLLDEDNVVSLGSRAICWAKRTLEIFDRLGVGDRMVRKGVTWQVGRVYHGHAELYNFDLLPEGGHKMPAFINLQQYYVEDYLVDRIKDFPDLIDLRWKNKVSAVDRRDDGVRLSVQTPDGAYQVEAEWVIAADGARSPIRGMLGLPFKGQVFEERFLIADVRMQAAFPSERWFWFAPPFHDGESALLHRQPDNVYRLDFQLGWNADPELERKPERVIPRVQAVVGRETPFDLEWCSVYAFRCARIDKFVHGRVIFVGDSAHLVSPFGARGGNGGIQDVDNLVWKLALVLKNQAPPNLINSYDDERGRGADENIANSRRTTNFMTPKTKTERAFRDGVLALAADLPFARRLLNAGRLSRPCSLDGLPLQTEDHGRVAGPMLPGMPCLDAPVTDARGQAGWLLQHLGAGFTLLHFADGDAVADLQTATAFGASIPICVVTDTPVVVKGVKTLADTQGLVRRRYGGRPGVTYVIRPDQHVAARFDRFDPAAISLAVARATGREAA